jgi:uncharacterized membrane protein YdfJ with MMPL/SSD domain
MPRRTLALVAIVAAIATVIGSGTPARLSSSENDLYSEGTQGFRTTQLLSHIIGRRAFPEIGVIFPLKAGGGPAALAEVQKVAHLIPKPVYSHNRQAVALLGYFRPGVPAASATAQLVTRLRRFPRVAVTSGALASQEFREQVEHDLIRAELIALPILLLLALLIFRSVVSAVLPVLASAVTLTTALMCLRSINALHPISILSLNLITGASLGLSIDYSLLLLTRFREELALGAETAEAARVTVMKAGRTVLLSAATVAVAFASLLIFPLAFLRSIAVGGVLVAGIAGIVAVTMLPAIFSLLGSRINALSPRRWQRSAAREARQERGLWHRYARFVMRRPVVIAAAGAIVLITLSVPSLGLRLTGLDAASLAPGTNTYKFEARVEREFTHSLFNEVIVVAHGNVDRIDTIVSSYMERLPDVEAGVAKRLRGNLWEFLIKTSHPPFSQATERLVRKIRSFPARLAVTGVTANYLDTAASLWQHLPWALALLIGSTAVFVFLATGSVILPLKAIVMNMLSLAAACGILVFIFQNGRLEGLLGYRGQGALVLIQPIILGTCAFGILTDYGIFLLARIKEGWDSGLRNDEAVAHGLERTGRTISSAAALFCVAVGALVTSHITIVKEVGVGVAAAVAIDATIVRAFVVPSLMMLLGQWNWWRPTVFSRWIANRGALKFDDCEVTKMRVKADSPDQ